MLKVKEILKMNKGTGEISEVVDIMLTSMSNLIDSTYKVTTYTENIKEDEYKFLEYIANNMYNKLLYRLENKKIKLAYYSNLRNNPNAGAFYPRLNVLVENDSPLRAFILTTDLILQFNILDIMHLEILMKSLLFITDKHTKKLNQIPKIVIILHKLLFLGLGSMSFDMMDNVVTPYRYYKFVEILLYETFENGNDNFMNSAIKYLSGNEHIEKFNHDEISNLKNEVQEKMDEIIKNTRSISIDRHKSLKEKIGSNTLRGVLLMNIV